MQTFSRYIWISCLALVHVSTSRDLNFTHDQRQIGKRFLSPFFASCFPPIMILRSCEIEPWCVTRCGEVEVVGRIKIFWIYFESRKKRFFSLFSISIWTKNCRAEEVQTIPSFRNDDHPGNRRRKSSKSGLNAKWVEIPKRTIHAGKIISSRP